jgi:DNA-directed RNA polymerase specialized sigma24 family protein
MNHQSRIAVVSEIADLQVVLAQSQSRLARLMQRVSEWDIPAPQVADAPSLLQSTTRTLETQGSDQEGALGLREQGLERSGSEQKSAEDVQGRNEPVSTETVSGATAGEVVNASSPAPRDLKRDAILDLWAQGLTKEDIAERTGSTPISVNTTVVIARRCNDPRAVRRSDSFDERREKILDLYAAGNPVSQIATVLGGGLKGIETVLYRARKAGEPRAAKHATKAIPEFAGRGREGDGDGVQSAAQACGNALEPVPANTITAKPKPKIMSTAEVMARLKSEVAAKAEKPAPAPYAKPMEPTEAKPIPAADLPAPIPALAIADDTVMIVADGLVHGPGGVEDRFTMQQLLILDRMADGGMYPSKVLSDISGATNGTLTYLLNGMRAKLAAIGVELFQPMKGFWRARRMGE